MDFDQYVAARYGRLIEHAVLTGCAEGEAGTVVDKVLVAQRRQIRRSKDPDPQVRDALEREIRGEPTRHRHGGPFAAVALVAGLALVGAVATYQPSPGQVAMPSLFGYDGTRASTYLHQLGLEVQLEPLRGCEPLGQVIGSQPKPGETVEEGSTVQVQTALPSDSFCESDYANRATAWDFVGFALGGPAPSLADQVTVVDAAASGSAGSRTLDAAQGRDQQAWGGVLDEVASASRAQVDSLSHMARLDVSDIEPPEDYCDRTRPSVARDREALRLQIDTSGGGDAQCPLTVDLYRDDSGLIDAVVLYPAG